MKFNQPIAIKAGLIGAAAGLVVALLGRIPFIGCIIAPLGWVVAVATGVLYVYLAGKVVISEGAVGGAVAGGIAGLVNAFISGVLSLLFGAAQATSSLLGGGEVGEAALGAGVSFIAVIMAIIVGAIAGAVLGAIGGGVYAAIKGQSK